MTFAEFKKLKIDTSKIGWIQTKDAGDYFCTPRGASVIGCAGVDGIHFCTVRGFGDMIFAVNPSNSVGKNVYPIAYNLVDLLRLLLVCCDMNIIEQAHFWDEEQFEENIKDLKESEFFDRSALDIISERCGLEPMEKPYEYLYRLQRSFNCSQLKFKNEYYELLEENGEWQAPAEWRVTGDGALIPERGKNGCELALDASFCWANENWHIPAVYLFPNGIVADFLTEIQPETFLAFKRYVENENSAAQDEVELLHKNPLSIDFHPLLTVNGEKVKTQSRRGELWLPESCREVGEEGGAVAKWIIDHYGFDRSKIWVISRSVFRSSSKIGDISTLSLKMEREKALFSGIRFTVSSVNDSFSFVHPVSDVEHTLRVLEYESQELPTDNFSDRSMFYPTHCAMMRYEISPELPENEFFVRDCYGGDAPLKLSPDTTSDDNDLVCAIGVIGSADGPIAISVGSSYNSSSTRTVYSSLYFELPKAIEWRVNFRIKTFDDIELSLIPKEKYHES